MDLHLVNSLLYYASVGPERHNKNHKKNHKEKKMELEKMNRCIDRYLAICGKLPSSQLDMLMDLHYSRVNTDRLLQLRESDFMHDMNGITANMDRKNCRLANCFVPRAGLLND